MALPNKGTRTDPKLRTRANNKQGRIGILVLLLSFVVCALVFYQSYTDFSEFEYTPDTLPVEKKIKLLSLPDESMFSKTLKHCLPRENKKCKTYVPENSGQRIALLAPPGDLTRSFSNVVEYVLGAARSKTKEGIEIEWIPTTHMAPYGYGKTHGLTKIIRIVPEPLLLGATDTLLYLSSGSSFPPSPSVEDIEASLRQQIRYHCRLNHIAAHTSLWTLTWKELSNMPIETLILQIQQFLDLEPLSQQVSTEVMTSMDFDQKSSVTKVTNQGFKLLHNFGGTSGNFYKILNSILLDEMRISKNLTAWPCQSFWTVGKSPQRLELSPTISQIAEAMSPNCTSPMNTCFVKRDKCEANGDGECT